jgi:hypothetical protein
MELEGSLPGSQELATCRYPERKAYMYELLYYYFSHFVMYLFKLFSHALQLQKD